MFSAWLLCPVCASLLYMNQCTSARVTVRKQPLCYLCIESAKLQHQQRSDSSEHNPCTMSLLSTSMAVQTPFSVSGAARAPSVQLSTSCLSFGSLAANESLTKPVYIHNQADLPIYFEFVTDQQGVFAFDRVHGSVAAQSSGSVMVTFQPKEAFNFWRSITCLIRVNPQPCPCQSPMLHIILHACIAVMANPFRASACFCDVCDFVMQHNHYQALLHLLWV